MRLVAICAAALATTTRPLLAELRCYDTGHSIHCPPGCVLTKPPYYPGDIYTWRCRRPYPPPVTHYQTPEPFCPSGTYSVGGGWCCPTGTVLSPEGKCKEPQHYRAPDDSPTYRTADDGTSGPIALAVFLALLIAVWDLIAKNAAAKVTHRDADDPDVGDVAAARESLNKAADEADEIIRKFKEKSYRDGHEDDV